MIEFLLLDLDDTILDFHKSESVAVRKALRAAGVDPTEDTVALYSRINKRHWEMLERGELDREQVKIFRFAALFDALGVRADAAACARNYEALLAGEYDFLPGAKETLEALSGRYRLFLLSNGTASVQAGRLTGANLYRFFEEVFISEELGANKPDPAFFGRCFARIPGFDRSRALMVGDSLTSDIQGGRNAGVATCWVNTRGAAPRPDIPADYEIPVFSALPALLRRL